MHATPQTLRQDLDRIHGRRYAREPMTYRVGDYVPAGIVDRAWELATETLVRKHRR